MYAHKMTMPGMSRTLPVLESGFPILFYAIISYHGNYKNDLMLLNNNVLNLLILLILLLPTSC